MSGSNTKIFLGGAKFLRSEHRTRKARSNLSWGVWGEQCKPPPPSGSRAGPWWGFWGQNPQKTLIFTVTKMPDALISSSI